MSLQMQHSSSTGSRHGRSCGTVLPARQQQRPHGQLQAHSQQQLAACSLQHQGHHIMIMSAAHAIHGSGGLVRRQHQPGVGSSSRVCSADRGWLCSSSSSSSSSRGPQQPPRSRRSSSSCCHAANPQQEAAAAAAQAAAAAPGSGNGSSSSSSMAPPQQPSQQQQQHRHQHQPGSSPPPPLQVTRSNFGEVLPLLRASLATCQFFAFDCEMSGLYLPGQEDYAVDDVDDRYRKAAAAAEAFLVTQFGLSLFTWVPDEGSGTGGIASGHYKARSFNFHVFPGSSVDWDPRFSCQASSLAFLAAQGFDFNKMISEGVPFMPLSLRDRQMMRSAAQAQKLADALPDLDALDDDEQCLLQELQDTISTWLSSSSSSSSPTQAAAAAAAAGDTLYLPSPPPQLMNLQRQLLAAGIGSDRWTDSSSNNSSSSSSSSSSVSYTVEPVKAGGGGGGSSGSGVVLRRATSRQLAAAAADGEQQRQALAASLAGFSTVMELLRESGKPAVGHNVRFDLAFALASFVQSPLPRSWQEFKGLVAEWLPGGVYDTKYLAHSLRCQPGGGPGSLGGTAAAGPGGSGGGGAGGSAVLADTGLGSLFRAFNAGATAGQPLGTPPAAPGAQRPGEAPFPPRSHALNAASLAEWLDGRTAPLDQPAAWSTLPRVAHAPGCEPYAAAAAAEAGLPCSSAGEEGGPVAAAGGNGTAAQQQVQQQMIQQQQQDGGGGLAHEAGYDAFMTGVVFVGLLRLYEIEGLGSMSRWLLPPGPAAPPQLSAVAPLAWRQHHCHSRDVAYAALQGPDPVPQRPEVLYLSGFRPSTRWSDIQGRFQKLGLGKPPVSMVRQANNAYGPPTGAYVSMPSAKEAAKALQVLKQDKSWKVKAVTYAEYWRSKQTSSNSSSGSGIVVARAVPSVTSTAAAAAAAAAGAAGSGADGSGSGGGGADSGGSSGAAAVRQEMQDLAQQLLRRTAAAKQKRQAAESQEEERQLQQQDDDGASTGAAVSQAAGQQPADDAGVGDSSQAAGGGRSDRSTSGSSTSGSSTSGSSTSGSSTSGSSTSGSSTSGSSTSGGNTSTSSSNTSSSSARVGDPKLSSLTAAAQRLQQLSSSQANVKGRVLQRPALRRAPPS